MASCVPIPHDVVRRLNAMFYGSVGKRDEYAKP